MGKSGSEPTVREPSQKVVEHPENGGKEQKLSRRDELKVDGVLAAFAFPPTRRLMKFFGDAVSTLPGLAEPFVQLETVSNYLRNFMAERTFWDLFKQPQATFSRMTNHVLDEDIKHVVELDNVKCVIFENSPASLAWILQLQEPTSTKNMWWRQDIGASEKEIRVDRDVSREFLAAGRTVFTIDCSVDSRSMGFTPESIGIQPSLSAFIGTVGVTGLLLFGKELSHLFGRRAIKNKEVVALFGKVLALAGVVGAIGVQMKSEMDEKIEGLTIAGKMGDFDSWFSEQFEGVKSENGFIGFEAYLTFFRNTIMTQNIKRIVAIYGGFPEFSKQFIGAGGGHSEIWQYIHKDLPGKNEERIREFALRLMNSTWETAVIAQEGNHNLSPRQLAQYFSKYCQLFSDFQMAGNNILPDGFISSIQLGAYQPSIEDPRLIPPAPRVILVETLRQKLVDAVSAGKTFEIDTLSNLAMMIFKQSYDENAVLQDQAAYWNSNREETATPFDNAYVQAIGQELLSKYELGYLANALLYVDQALNLGTSSEIAIQDTVCSTVNGNIILGAAIHNGTTIPLIRRFSPTLKNAIDINKAVLLTKPDVITAQDGFVLPGGIFIPIAPQLTYRKVSADYQRAEDNQLHTSLYLPFTGEQKVEVIRSKSRLPKVESALLYVREGADRETQLNMDELIIG